MGNRFNINESEKNRIRALHNINEQYTPEERVTDNQCVGTTTPKVVLEVFDELTKDYGYECIGREETMTSGYDPQPINKVILKKNIQGISIYVFIDELDWGGLIEVGDVSYYIPNNETTRKLNYRAGEGRIKNLNKDLEKIEDEVWEVVRKGVE